MYGTNPNHSRTLPKTWPKSRSVPWCGPYMKDHEDEIWPLLFVYAKNGKHKPDLNKIYLCNANFSVDRLLSWRYVEEVVRRQELRGRQVLTTRFDR